MKLAEIETGSPIRAIEAAGALVAACGYESRARAIVDHADMLPDLRVALAFEEHKLDRIRAENEARFESAGFENAPTEASDPAAILPALARLERLCSGSQAELLVDISSMSRAWYGGLIRNLRDRPGSVPVTVSFWYYPGIYSNAYVQGVPNTAVQAVPGFQSVRTPDWPVALVLGTGFDLNRAVGIEELLEPKKSFRFVPAANRGQMIDLNIAPEEASRQALVIPYRLDQPYATFCSLESACSGLLSRYRVSLCSIGPKIFSLLCFLVGVELEEVGVWRVSSESLREPTDVMAAKDMPIVCRTVWLPEEIRQDSVKGL